MGFTTLGRTLTAVAGARPPRSGGRGTARWLAGGVLAVVVAAALPGAALAAPGAALAQVTPAAALARSAATAAPVATGSGWSVVPSPNALTRQDGLAAVSCPTTGTCIAVGRSMNPAGAFVPLVKTWNGLTWTRQRVPAPAAALSSELRGLWCVSARLCTAVGGYTDGAGTRLPLAERWNGRRWTIQATPGRGSLAGVSCPSARACTAVGGIDTGGDANVMLAEGWNGRRWAIQRVHATPDRDDLLTGVSCISARACVAVGHAIQGDLKSVPVVERWNGTKWAGQQVPGPADEFFWFLAGVSCSSARACTAVGHATNVDFDYSLPLVMHWNGRRWARQHVPGPGLSGFVFLTGVSCPSAGACMAAGYSANGGFSAFAPVTEKWDGSAWSTPPNAASSGSLAGVSCSSPTACTAAGNSVDTFNGVTLVERWDGTAWAIQPTPGNPAGAASSSLAAVACTSGTVCTAVGSGGGHALAERWAGGKWAIQPVPEPAGAVKARLTGVSCTSGTACTAVGGYQDTGGAKLALAERWDGTAWSIQQVAAGTQTLSGVSCPSATACTAVGSDSSGPVAERWDGTAWTLQPLAAGAVSVSGVSCPSVTACTAVGSSASGPVAERWDGTAWTRQTVPGRGSLSGVSCATVGACTAVGDGIAERWNGTAWSVQTLPAPGTLSGVWCHTATTCTAVGVHDVRIHGVTDPAVLVDHWNGAAWSLQSAPRPRFSQLSSLSGVMCTSARRCIAVGSYFRNTDVTLVERRS